MLFSLKKVASLVSVVTALSAFGTYHSAVASPLTLDKRAQCAATLSTAHSVAQRLHSKYWNGSGWGIFWTDAVSARLSSLVSNGD